MPTTENITPHLNPDPAVVKKLQETLPAAAKQTFSSSNPGMLAFYRGKIIQARNISDRTDAEHSGLALLLGQSTEVIPFYPVIVDTRQNGMKYHRSMLSGFPTSSLLSKRP